LERLFYWRDGEYGVDLIAGMGGMTIPMEIKSRKRFSTVSWTDISGNTM